MANNDEIPPQPIEIDGNIYCPNLNCQTLIGHYIRVGKQTWLQVGALQLQSAHGRCCQCHTEYHWCASDKKLEDLIKKVIEKRKPVL